MDKITQDIRRRQELKQETSAVVVQQDLRREEFKDELVEARRCCEGSTKVVQSRVEEVREEVWQPKNPLGHASTCVA